MITQQGAFNLSLSAPADVVIRKQRSTITSCLFHPSQHAASRLYTELWDSKVSVRASFFHHMMLAVSSNLRLWLQGGTWLNFNTLTFLGYLWCRCLSVPVLESLCIYSTNCELVIWCLDPPMEWNKQALKGRWWFLRLSVWKGQGDRKCS